MSAVAGIAGSLVFLASLALIGIERRKRRAARILRGRVLAAKLRERQGGES